MIDVPVLVGCVVLLLVMIVVILESWKNVEENDVEFESIDAPELPGQVQDVVLDGPKLRY